MPNQRDAVEHFLRDLDHPLITVVQAPEDDSGLLEGPARPESGLRRRAGWRRPPAAVRRRE